MARCWLDVMHWCFPSFSVIFRLLKPDWCHSTIGFMGHSAFVIASVRARRSGRLALVGVYTQDRERKGGRGG